MIKSLLSIIGKNMKISIRSKASTLAILLVPLLIVFLVGTAFSSNSLSGIKAGVYSSSYSNVSNSIITSLENGSFKITRFDSEDSCVNSVRTGGSSVCIVFPPELSTNGNNGSIIFNVDNSQVNLAYALIDKVNSKISKKNSELGTVLATDLIQSLENVKETINADKAKLSNSISSSESVTSSINDSSKLVPNMNNIISNLKDAEESVGKLNGSSDAVDSISDVISDLQSLGNSNWDLSKNLAKANGNSESLTKSLSAIYSDVNSLIINLNKSSINNAEEIVSPISSKVNTLTENTSNWDYLFPTLVALIILLSGMILSSNLVMSEKRTRAHFRNFMTPTQDFTFILGVYLTCLIFLVAQLVILFLGTAYLTGLNLSGLPEIVLVVFLSASVFIFLGMCIGYLFKSDETSLLTSIFIAAILMFFSNIIFPIESITHSFRQGILYNPLYITDSLLKKILLFGAPISSFYSGLIILAVTLVVLCALSYIFRKATKRLL